MGHPAEDVPVSTLADLIDERQETRRKAGRIIKPLLLSAVVAAYIVSAMFVMELATRLLSDLQPGEEVLGSLGELAIGAGLLSFAAVQWFTGVDREARETELEMIHILHDRLQRLEARDDDGGEDEDSDEP